MNDLLNTLAREQLKADLPEIRPGDTVRVSVRVVEGNRERLQNFEGTVLRVRNGGIDKQITVRRMASALRHRAIAAWSPESSTAGTRLPSWSTGRVYCGPSSSPSVWDS